MFVVQSEAAPQRCGEGEFLRFDTNVESCNTAASKLKACKDIYWVQTGEYNNKKGRCYCATITGTECSGGWQQNSQYNDTAYDGTTT